MARPRAHFSRDEASSAVRFFVRRDPSHLHAPSCVSKHFRSHLRPSQPPTALFITSEPSPLTRLPARRVEPGHASRSFHDISLFPQIGSSHETTTVRLSAMSSSNGSLKRREMDVTKLYVPISDISTYITIETTAHAHRTSCFEVHSETSTAVKSVEKIIPSVREATLTLLNLFDKYPINPTLKCPKP